MLFGPQEEAFRKEVREFIDQSLPKDIAQKHLAGMEMQKEDYMRWHKILAEKAGSRPTGQRNMAAANGTRCSVIFSTKKPALPARPGFPALA